MEKTDRLRRNYLPLPLPPSAGTPHTQESLEGSGLGVLGLTVPHLTPLQPVPLNRSPARRRVRAQAGLTQTLTYPPSHVQ